MLVRLLVSPTQHIQGKTMYSHVIALQPRWLCRCKNGTNLRLVMTLVAGIRAPTTERLNPSNQKVQPAEEHGNEARQFVEDRLLQRNVRIDVLGLSPQNQLIASVKHPRGSIALFLLEAGLARCTDFHSTMLGADMAPLRSAEKKAQTEKLGLFKDHIAKAAAGGANLEAQVTRVFSADVVYVRNRAGVEKRISISSVRGPRPSDPTGMLLGLYHPFMKILTLL
jgi:staphylococcal nuclease domain-containing protein 1